MSAEIRVIRAIVAVLVGIAALRIYSYAREREHRGLADFFDFLSIALFSPHLVYSPHRYVALPLPKGREIARLLIALPLIPLTWMAAMRLIRSDVISNSFWLNHLVLVVGFVIIMQSFGQLSLAIWRLRGLKATPLVDNILLSRTPADFWRRWSWPVHLWLYRYVYVPSGGKRHHVRAVIAVFAVSALLHEILAAFATGRVTGHQTIFFALSALGVLASPALESLSRFGIVGQVVMRALTLIFLATAAAFMFATLHFVFPIYAKQTWLLW